jgi:atypical protein kinase C zeta type
MSAPFNLGAALSFNANCPLGFGLRDTPPVGHPVTGPVIKIPRCLSFYELLSGGAVGWVYKINDRVALKYTTDPNDKRFKNEIAFFDILEKHEPCPDIVQSFLRVPTGNFLSFMSCGSLHQRLQSHQLRNADGTIQVTGREPDYLIAWWLAQLCSALAWLESLGYVHGDIRPPNLLLDAQEHLKLADFDCVAPIGSPSEGAGPPWARVQGPEAGDGEGSFGECGPKTEQFAVGSILYCLTRGHEPFEMDKFDDDAEVVGLLRRMEFPPLSDNPFDAIIKECWAGRFTLLRDLLQEARSQCGDNEIPQPVTFTSEYRSGVRSECQRLVDGGLLELK